MINEVQTGGKACLEAIKALRVLITESYDEGGWLPAGRAMAETIGVSHPTYCKALRFMETEGVVKSFPKKGHYVVPSYLRCDKVGLIINDGGESPFIHQDGDFGGAVTMLAEGGYDSQIIQAAFLEQLFGNALIYGMKGLIWFHPSVKAMETVREIDTAGQLPLVVVKHDDSDVDFGKHGVTYDSRESCQIRANLLLERGHREIAYVGDYEAALQHGLVEAVEAAGGHLPPERCVASLEKMPGAITDLVQNAGVTGILSEGGGFTVNCLFEELSELPEAVQPDVVVNYFGQLPKLAKRFTKVKLVPYLPKPVTTLGREAASMLLGHLTDGTPLTNRKVGYTAPTAEQ
jgi:DNA-binding LacI/PurR family transcriptional regulator